ncbi:DUF2511 domain-containing protein [Pseudomonas sp. A1230]|uniref:DUF2511 domain-containing protein n=1 Tax=Pseudomonas sp. A1230 TaxID=3235106 RepID=UPI003782EE24
MLKGMLALIGICTFVALAGCGADSKTETVSSKDFGDNWPFTVESAELSCEPNPPKALMRTSDGTLYALNASALKIASERGWSDARDLAKPSRWVPSVKMDHVSISQRAIDLCPTS